MFVGCMSTLSLKLFFTVLILAIFYGSVSKMILDGFDMSGNKSFY